MGMDRYLGLDLDVNFNIDRELKIGSGWTWLDWAGLLPVPWTEAELDKTGLGYSAVKLCLGSTF